MSETALDTSRGNSVTVHKHNPIKPGENNVWERVPVSVTGHGASVDADAQTDE